MRERIVAPVILLVFALTWEHDYGFVLMKIRPKPTTTTSTTLWNKIHADSLENIMIQNEEETPAWNPDLELEQAAANKEILADVYALQLKRMLQEHEEGTAALLAENDNDKGEALDLFLNDDPKLGVEPDDMELDTEYALALEQEMQVYLEHVQDLLETQE